MTIAYLVDFDGTLADTSDANYLAYSGALQEVGIHVSREQFDKEAFGRNWRQFLPILLKNSNNNSDPATIAARKVVLYRDTARNIRFNEALIHILINRGREIKAALVTSASAANVTAALASRADLTRIFDVMITGDDVTHHKPHPQGFEMAAKHLGVTPADCIVFEDSDIGIEAGRTFGARVLKVCI